MHYRSKLESMWPGNTVAGASVIAWRSKRTLSRTTLVFRHPSLFYSKRLMLNTPAFTLESSALQRFPLPSEARSCNRCRSISRFSRHITLHKTDVHIVALSHFKKVVRLNSTLHQNDYVCSFRQRIFLKWYFEQRVTRTLL